jgi:hypothetical protein
MTRAACLSCAVLVGACAPATTVIRAPDQAQPVALAVYPLVSIAGQEAVITARVEPHLRARCLALVAEDGTVLRRSCASDGPRFWQVRWTLPAGRITLELTALDAAGREWRTALDRCVRGMDVVCGEEP